MQFEIKEIPKVNIVNIIYGSMIHGKELNGYKVLGGLEVLEKLEERDSNIEAFVTLNIRL